MNNIPRENVIIVAGDFNCTLDHTVDRIRQNICSEG